MKIIVIMKDTILHKDGSEEIVDETSIPMETYIDPHTGLETIKITNTHYDCNEEKQ